MITFYRNIIVNGKNIRDCGSYLVWSTWSLCPRRTCCVAIRADGMHLSFENLWYGRSVLSVSSWRAPCSVRSWSRVWSLKTTYTILFIISIYISSAAAQYVIINLPPTPPPHHLLFYTITTATAKCYNNIEVLNNLSARPTGCVRPAWMRRGYSIRQLIWFDRELNSDTCFNFKNYSFVRWMLLRSVHYLRASERRFSSLKRVKTQLLCVTLWASQLRICII